MLKTIQNIEIFTKGKIYIVIKCAKVLSDRLLSMYRRKLLPRAPQTHDIGKGRFLNTFVTLYKIVLCHQIN